MRPRAEGPFPTHVHGSSPGFSASLLLHILAQVSYGPFPLSPGLFDTSPPPTPCSGASGPEHNATVRPSHCGHRCGLQALKSLIWGRDSHEERKAPHIRRDGDISQLGITHRYG
jgi:hypothetical protein